MALVDDELVRAARALARQLIERTRSPGANSRRSANSSPSPFCARDLVAGERLRGDRRDDPAQRLGQRVDAQRVRPVEPRLPDEQAEPVARAQSDVAELVVAPAHAAEPRARASARRPSRAARDSVLAPDATSSPSGTTSSELEPLDRRAPRRRSSSTPSSSCSSARSRSSVSHTRTSGAAPSAQAERERERERQRRARRARAGATRARRAGRAPRARRTPSPAATPTRVIPRAGAGSSAAGVGTLSSSSRTTSSAGEPLHPELRPQHQPVRERGHGDRLDVVRGDEVAARRARPCSARASAAARLPRGLAPTAVEPLVARRRDELDDVAADGSRRRGRCSIARLQLEQRRRRRSPARARPRPRARSSRRDSTSHSSAAARVAERRPAAGSGRAAPRAAGRCPRTRSGSGSRARGTAARAGA